MTMDFLGARVQLNPRPARQLRAALEVALLGHAPGRVRLARLLQHPDMLDEIRQLGFNSRVAALSETSDDRLTHLPLPLHSTAEFDDIFPEARSAATRYRSTLAGAAAWLPWAVDDFFANGGERLWVIVVPEVEGVAGFLFDASVPAHEVEKLRGAALLSILERVGVVAMPDLERLQIPAALQDIARKRLANPTPQFLPLGTDTDDDHRERRYSSELLESPAPLPLLQILNGLLPMLEQRRPDLQCLFTLPLDYSPLAESPTLDRKQLAALDVAIRSPGAQRLRQLQLVFPYLRHAGQRLASPVGLLAGLMASSARRRGIWRSVAGLPMLSAARPYPSLSVAEAVALRQEPGIGIVQARGAQLVLDDERLTVPALFAGDYPLGSRAPRFDGYRSGEVARFMGFLRRELKTLGESLVFNLSADDPRPRLLLEQFFRDLHRAGALRGSLPEQAFQIRPLRSADNVLAFEIVIAPAFPIDRLVLTFVNRDTEWAAEVRSG